MDGSILRDRFWLQVALAGDDPFYAMEGPSLAGPLRRDCAAPVLRGGNRSSPVFSDPSVFPHAVWLSAVWTADGETVHGLVHDEYHGDRALNGTSSCPGTCWYTTVLQVVSTNGGRSFTYATSPSNPRPTHQLTSSSSTCRLSERVTD